MSDNVYSELGLITLEKIIIRESKEMVNQILMIFSQLYGILLAILNKTCLKRYIENAYFDQRLECAAPKCWSKFTTYVQHRKKG